MLAYLVDVVHLFAIAMPLTVQWIEQLAQSKSEETMHVALVILKLSQELKCSNNFDQRVARDNKSKLIGSFES